METTTLSSTKVKWVTDPAHSELYFRVKHMMITNVKGEFRKFEASINGADFTKSAITARIDASSIFTNDENRDKHLRSADFFDAENHQELLFESKSVSKVDDENYIVKGMLTIKGIAKEVSLNVEYGGVIKDPWGNMKAGYSFNTKINRKDWGLNWNAALEAGGVLVSDEVRINGEIQFVQE